MLKIWLIGARGTIATSLVVGTLAWRRGLLPLEAVVTETPPLRDVLPPLDEVAFGGCDLRDGPLAGDDPLPLAAFGEFPPAVVAAVLPALRALRLTRGILRGGGPAIEALAGDGAAALRAESAADAVARLAADLRAFAGDAPTVVVNLASTEPPPAPALLSWDLATFEAAVADDDARLPASALYALAALRAGLPYVNFTPSAGASLPALVELARREGLPLAGRDGKTGETLVKTALAPMFAIRALAVEGWYGTNILGNTDGLVLADPDNRASKIATKGGVLEGCLGYTPAGDVRIDYFPPLGDHKVAWNFVQFRGWGGHRMRLQLTWEGTDAVLAAPLVLDLARLVLLARARGEGGPVGALGLFFKSPEGSREMNLHRQFDALLRWAAPAAAGG